MTKFLHLIIIIFIPTYLFSETVTIYATQSAQYSANDCCTLNILTNQNSDSLYSQDCQDMGAYYGCGMSKHVPFWIFDLSTVESNIDIQSIQFKGNLPTESWSDVYLSVSTTVGQISTTIASDLWSGGDWDSGNGEYSSINWPMGDFSQNLPSEIISQGIISGQLNILTYTSNPWTIFSIVNSGDNAPRLVIDYDNINENCINLSGIPFPECGSVIGFGYIEGECLTMYCSPIDGYGVDWSNWIYNTIEECEEVCGTNNPITLGDINFDGAINILDVDLLVSFILGEPTDESVHTAANVNGDSQLDVFDAVLLIDMIFNPQLPNECYIAPEVGPCDGICPTYYYNQSTNECEEFITGCCGVEAFNTLQECQNTCE